AERAHLGLEQAVRVDQLLALERVGANQLGEPVRLVRGRAAHGPHLDQRDLVATLRELPRCLAAGQAAADDSHLRHDDPVLLRVTRPPPPPPTRARTRRCTRGSGRRCLGPSSSSRRGTAPRSRGTARGRAGPTWTSRSPGTACSPRTSYPSASASLPRPPRRSAGT